MLRSVTELQDSTIAATDGPIGHLRDFYFDDVAWVVRYLIVDTGSWLSGRRVLVSPMAVGAPQCKSRTIPVKISREQVRNSPGIDTAQPVSRQHEREYLDYYRYPYYWDGRGFWGDTFYPSTAAAAGGLRESTHDPVLTDDPHLRSCAAVAGYRIHATDGELGHVHGYILDTVSWAIRYLVVDSSNWWLGHQVLIAPQWITRVDWDSRSVVIDLNRQAIREAPAYDYMTPLERVSEIATYRHYGRTGYWTTEPQRDAA